MSDDLYSLFYKDSIFAHTLCFDGTDGIGAVLDTAQTLNYQQQNFAFEGIHTITKVVDMFVPIFEIIAFFLCAAMVFILVNFSTKMIKDKIHEIGILKALGMKNSTIVAALSAISMLIPMIKIKAIKPVKIIKAKE